MKSSEEFDIREISANESLLWDSLVDSSPHGTVFHTWDFVSTMAEHSRMKILGKSIRPVFHPLIISSKDEDIGLIPLYEFTLGPIKYIFSPPPSTAVTYLGPCITFHDKMRQSTKEKIQRSFLNAVEGYIGSIGAKNIKIRTSPGFDDARPYLWLNYNVTPLYNYCLDIDRPSDEILQQMGRQSRKLIRGTKNKGYTFREGDLKDLERLFAHQTECYAGQGLDMNISLKYLKALWDKAHPERLRIFVLEDDDGYVTSLLETFYKKKLVSWIGTARNDSKPGDINLLLKWKVMMWAKEKGYKNIETLWANEERLNPFKTKINPTITTYYSASKNGGFQKAAQLIRHAFGQSNSWGDKI